jgi:hypothetical protein
MKNQQKELALKLRIEQQLSINQICKITGLAKSTLSLHLRNYPLSKDRIKELKIGSQINGAAVNKQKSLKRKEQYKKDGIKLLKNNSKFRDLCFLYWGEGAKWDGVSSFKICNTDVYMIKTIINILTTLGYRDNIVCTCYCHEHSDLEKIKAYWKEVTNLEIRTYIPKKSKASKQLKPNKQPNGTLEIVINRKELLYNIFGGIEQLKNEVG